MTDNPPATTTPSCAKNTLARLNNGLYYLSLGAWFGAIVMLAISAAATFKTMRGYGPIIPGEPWNQPGLAERAPVILAGAAVGASLTGLKVVQTICAIIACATAALQCSVFSDYLTSHRRSGLNILRLLLLAVPVVLLLLNVFHITPRTIQERDIMWDMQQTQQVRDDANARFQTYHKLSERTTGAAGFSLAAAVLVSSLVLGSRARQRDSVVVGSAAAKES